MVQAGYVAEKGTYDPTLLPGSWEGATKSLHGKLAWV